MRTLARLSLAVGLAAVLVGPAPRSQADAAAPSGLQLVTYDVGTHTTSRTTLPSGAAKAGGSGALRPGHRPATAVDADERPSPRKIFGADDREPVEDTTRYPFSTVAKVFSTFPDGAQFEGSAVLVGRRQALTAGHVVYDADHGGWAEYAEVVIALDRDVAPYGSAFASRLRSFGGFVDDGDPDYDFGLIELDVVVGDTTGWLGLAVRDDATLLGDPVNTAGYPGDLDDGYGMWYAGGFAADVDARTIYMDGVLDAAQGQSGSGVWQRVGDDRYVVGVLSAESPTANLAGRVTQEIFDVVDAWLDGYDGPADLAPSAVTTSLPFRTARGATGVVSFEIDNFGFRPATFLAAAYLDDGAGHRLLLGSTDVTVGADRFKAVEITARVPADAASGTYTVVAVVNGDDAVPESDRSNNEAEGPLVLVQPGDGEIPPGTNYWEPVTLPAKLHGRLVPNGESRYTFTISEPLSALKLRLRGPRFLGFALVVRPDGSTFKLLPRRSYKTIENQPQLGEWLLLVKNRPDASRSRRFKVKLKVK